jgi:cytidylate kinase
MENLLHEYMNRRLDSEITPFEAFKEFGPVITISRQAGCGASRIAHDLCKVLNSAKGMESHSREWHFINHEILEKSAEKLNLEPNKLDRVITDKERGIMDEILEALSSNRHKSDKKIMKTMQEVIRQFAEHGRVVIVGRGGAVVSQHIQKALHIRLEAPFEWRKVSVMKKLEYSREYAAEYIHKLDEQRHMYVQRMTEGMKNPSLYDIVLDPSRFTEKQLVEIIIKMAEVKGLI